MTEHQKYEQLLAVCRSYKNDAERLQQELAESRRMWKIEQDGKLLLMKKRSEEAQQIKDYKQALELACKGFCLSKSCDKEACPVPLKANGHCDGHDQAVRFFLEQARKEPHI